jgi:hypothetical protein
MRTCVPSCAAEWTAKSASYRPRISNASTTDSAPQLPISSFCCSEDEEYIDEDFF